MRQNAGVRCAAAPEVCSWRELLVGQGANRIQREIEEYKALSQEVMQPDEDYFPRRAELPAFAYNNRGRGIDREVETYHIINNNNPLAQS